MTSDRSYLCPSCPRAWAGQGVAAYARHCVDCGLDGCLSCIAGDVCNGCEAKRRDPDPVTCPGCLTVCGECLDD